MDEKNVRRAIIKINLFDIATGPFHHDYTIRPLKVIYLMKSLTHSFSRTK